MWVFFISILCGTKLGQKISITKLILIPLPPDHD
jgi:hypothetical protein